MPTIMNLKRAEIIAAQLKAIQVPENVIKPLRNWVMNEKVKIQKAEIEKQQMARLEAEKKAAEEATKLEAENKAAEKQPPGPRADKKNKK